MNSRKKRLLGLAASALGLVVIVQVALATHPRPKSASPVRVSLVTAFEECTSPNSTHGPPLQFQSCTPPVESSKFVTIGGSEGVAANSTGSVRVSVKVGTPGPPEDSAVLIVGDITDVRCKAAAQTCGSPNAEGGPDYTGELEGTFDVRLTDHFNGPNRNEAGTVMDLPQPFHLFCAATSDPSIGSTCHFPVVTCSSCPPPKEGVRTVAELSQVQIRDGGADGRATTADNTLFMVQGVFLP